MIGIIFQYGGEVVETRIVGTTISFKTSTFGTNYVPFESLHLSKEGVLKEFPDLESDEMWRQKAIERFKDEMKKLKSEDKVANYLINDLKKYGYIPKYKQRQGFRVEALE